VQANSGRRKAARQNRLVSPGKSLLPTCLAPVVQLISWIPERQLPMVLVSGRPRPQADI